VTPEERPEDVEALNEYVDALLAGQKPTAPPSLKGAQAEALRMAAMLASVESHQAQPSAAFVGQLKQRLQTTRRAWWSLRLSRRGLARGLAGGVAVLAGCLFGEQGLQRIRGGQPVPAGWVPVAEASDLPPGTVKRFVAGDVQGHIMNIGGSIWALSAICTHQACVLNWRPEDQEFMCPCHGAEFDTHGQQVASDYYGIVLSPLSKIPVQQLDGTIFVVTG